MRLLLPLFLLLLISSCQSLTDLYEKGDYDKSYKAALRKLNDKPQDEEARLVLQNSLQELLATGESEIRVYREQQDPDAWRKAIKLAERHQEQIVKARPFTELDFAAEQEWFVESAAGFQEDLYYHYLETGLSTLEIAETQDNAALGQRAYSQFSNAQDYGEPYFTDYDAINDYLDRAVAVGVVYYEVAIDDGFNIGLGANVDAAFFNLENRSTLFLQINKEFMATGGDCSIDINFGEFESTIEETASTNDYQERVIIDYRTETDTSGNKTEIPIYGDVYGEVEIVISRKTAFWEVYVNVDPQTNNCHISGNSYRQTATSEIQYYHVSGDDRAIPPEFRDTGFTPEHTSDDDMANQLLDHLQAAIINDYF